MNRTTARMYGCMDVWHSFAQKLASVCPDCESGVSEWLCRAVSKIPNVTVLLLVTERCGEFDATLYRILHSELQCSLDYPGPFIHRRTLPYRISEMYVRITEMPDL